MGHPAVISRKLTIAAIRMRSCKLLSMPQQGWLLVGLVSKSIIFSAKVKKKDCDHCDQAAQQQQKSKFLPVHVDFLKGLINLQENMKPKAALEAFLEKFGTNTGFSDKQVKAKVSSLKLAKKMIHEHDQEQVGYITLFRYIYVYSIW